MSIQKMEDLAEDYYHRVLLNKPGNVKSDKKEEKAFYIDKGQLLAGNALYNFLLEFKELNALDERSHALTRALVKKADHGILSSFALYNEISKVEDHTAENDDDQGKCFSARKCLEMLVSAVLICELDPHGFIHTLLLTSRIYRVSRNRAENH